MKGFTWTLCRNTLTHSINRAVYAHRKMFYAIKRRPHRLKSLSVPWSKGPRFKDIKMFLIREAATTALCSDTSGTERSLWDPTKLCQETGNWDSPFRSWNPNPNLISLFLRHKESKAAQQMKTSNLGRSQARSSLLPKVHTQTWMLRFSNVSTKVAKHPRHHAISQHFRGIHWARHLLPAQVDKWPQGPSPKGTYYLDTEMSNKSMMNIKANFQ